MTNELHRRFWRKFREGYWEREGAVFRGVAKGSLGTEAMILRGIRRRAKAEADFARMPPLKLYRGESPQALDLPHPEHASFAPGDGDKTLRGYLRRLQAVTGEGNLGFIVNHVHALDPGISRRTSEFLDGALEVLPFPSGGTLCTSFFGTYKKTQVGIHKDDQNVLVLPVAGHKEFHLWSFESLQTHPAVVAMGDAARRSKARIPGLDPSQVEHLAQRVDVGPGDLLYIPKGTWHVAFPSGAYNASLHIGFFNEEPSPARLAPYFLNADKSFHDVEAAERLAGHPDPRLFLQWRSGHGLGLQPPATKPTTTDIPLICVAPRSSSLVPCGEVGVEAFAGGRSYRLPRTTPRMRQAVARVLSGKAFTRAAIRRACASKVEGAAIVALVDHFEAWGAVARAT